MPATDPTIRSLARINEREYVHVESVPIFIPHSRIFPDGDSVTVTEADLPLIAEGINRRHERSGVLVRVTDGHIDPNSPESNQPPLIGFASNAKVGTFGPLEQPAVLADLWIRREFEGLLSQRPYRSSEYYPKRKEIRGVALLLRDPQLDMGILHYSRSSDFLYRPVFQIREGSMSVLRNYAGHPMAPSMGGSIEPKPPGAADVEMTPEEEASAEKYFRYCMKKYGKPESWMEQYEASAASGTNTNVPNAGGPPPESGGLVPNSRAESARLYAMETELQILRVERDREQVERLLDSLEHVERYEIDRSKELTRMLRLSPSDRQVRAAEIRRYHAQIPGTSPIQVYRGAVEGGPDNSPLNARQMEEAVAYQSAEKCSWPEAMAYVRKAGR